MDKYLALEKYIEEHIELIDAEKFEDLYYAKDFPMECSKGQLSELLYKADIDPLSHLNHVPVGFLSNCSEVKELTLPPSINYVSRMAFQWSGIKKITINKECKQFNIGAFSYADWLKEIIIPKDSILTRIAEDAFDACVSLERIELPHGLLTIEGRAFNRCSSLKYVSLPNTINTLGGAIFSACDNLLEINFNGTRIEFVSILNVSNALWDSRIKQIICTDGIILKEELP